MPADFNSLSEKDKYNLLKAVVEKVRAEDGNGDEFAFKEDEGYVNLIAARGFKDGKSCVSANDVHDDTIFVVFKDKEHGGEPRVKAFAGATEYSKPGSTSILALGQHKYYLHYHHRWEAQHAHLLTTNSWLGPNGAQGKKYRALVPEEPGVRTWLDTTHNLKKDADEHYETDNLINIHYGGENKPGDFSKGCQLIQGWGNFKDFIKLVESDKSIKGSINNELASKPATNGTRPVIYTLVMGTFIEETLRSGLGTALPISLGDSRNVNTDTLDQYYHHTEKDADAGYYPVGANTVWHGGVHIYVPKGTEVYSCLPGRIVAARLAPEPEQAEGYYGSRNFILVRHERDGQVFYSLYMHLNSIALSEDDPFIKRLKWLGMSRWYRFKVDRWYRSVPTKVGNEKLGTISEGTEVEWIQDDSNRPWKKIRYDGQEVFASLPPEVADPFFKPKPSAELLNQLKSGQVVSLDIEIGGNQLLWQSGEYGVESQRKGLMHWEIFSQDSIFPPSEDASASEDSGSEGEGEEETGAETDSGRSVLVREVEGPEHTYPTAKVTYNVTKFNHTDATPGEIKKTNWVVKIDGSEVLRKQRQGKSFTFSVAEEWKGKNLVVMPYLNSETERYSVKTKVAQRKPVHWQNVEDNDDDFNMDIEAIQSLFADSQLEGVGDTDQILTSRELKRFYSESSDAEKIRAYACKFVSEWGIQDIDNAISTLEGRNNTAGLKERIEPYQWWKEASDAGCELPDAKCWHYNPITFLEALYMSGLPAPHHESPAEPARGDKYGGHLLQRGDRDNHPDNGGSGHPRWGGADDAPPAVEGCSAATADPKHVEQLQKDLRALGFSLVGNPEGVFGRKTEWAVREFQIYAKMANVARVKEAASEQAKQDAHLVMQGLSDGTEGGLSVYVNSLEQVANDKVYTGHASGVVNAATREAIAHWLENKWRCPVIIEAWSDDRSSLYKEGSDWAVNLWVHDDITSQSPRVFVRDFTGYYTLPGEHSGDDMFVLGYFSTSLWKGPLSVPPGHTWDEGELLPASLVGAASLSAAQRSTFKAIRATAEQECYAFYDSVNSYDNAFVSVGPCHWILGGGKSDGSVSKGELPGYLAYLRYADSAAYDKAFGFFGLRPEKAWVGEDGKADGAGLFMASQKKYEGWVALEKEDGSYGSVPQMVDDANYFKTWHWFYRFIMAGRTVEGYRRRMWDMARIRMRDIRSTPWGDGVANVADGSDTGRAPTIADVFTSERANAIILRWHVRFPAHMVSSGPGSHLRGALNRAKRTEVAGGWDGDPSDWTDAHEHALINGLLSEAAGLSVEQGINNVNNWPNWLTGSNPSGYALTDPVSRLSRDRGSLDFAGDGLPVAPA